MIWKIFAVTLPGFAIGALFMAMASRSLRADAARARWLKLGVFFLIVHAVLGVAALGRPWVTALLFAILAACVGELRRAWLCMPVPRPVAIWPVFAIITALALASSWLLRPAAFAFVFLVAAACDGFSQVVGQLVGRRRLAPQVSPGKTFEGFLGGLVAAVVIALLLRELLPGMTPWRTVLLAACVALAGLGGDLAASWAKRRAGIKDYSAALPGQGGFLDRFDSLLGALAVAGPVLLVSGG